MWEKEEILLSGIFSFSHNVFQKPSSSGLLQLVIVWWEDEHGILWQWEKNLLNCWLLLDISNFL